MVSQELVRQEKNTGNGDSASHQRFLRPKNFYLASARVIPSQKVSRTVKSLAAIPSRSYRIVRIEEFQRLKNNSPASSLLP